MLQALAVAHHMLTSSTSPKLLEFGGIVRVRDYVDGADKMIIY